ncbi:class I adenylate-forming enzyme family protein [Maribacter sp. PR1]|uniref:Class I adenylate-forming enzyme family protein n=1 Tax=Maribacter cobaltidurans TaxID=1178778 RepID=A0ABU7IWA4_9FLAO|nr:MULTISPECIES: class I adenylate-forming enzyme family protein [Maribacter]MDC6389784.1 class I adenylate-forming enzyme family protein [Maribacter sp. PR1]MEE1977174.1 class I adenylate-forming enzyme family protein [Maribacter cobaltidurans]
MPFVSIEEKIFEWARRTPEKTALVDKKVSITYKELVDNIWSVKAKLEKDFFIEKDDVVLLAANKNVNFIYSYFALHLIGAKVAPLDEQIQVDKLDHVVDQTKPKLIVGLALKNDNRCYDFDIFKNIESTNIPVDIDYPKVKQHADVLFTTGTTGNPKGVLLTHGNIAASAENINTFVRNTNSDIELLALPISHSFGLGRIKCVLSAGGTLVLLGSIVNMKRMFRSFEEHKITGFGMVPASWEYIQKMSGNRLSDFSEQLNYIELGSAYMSPKDKKHIKALFPNTRICMHYGLTEASRSAFMEFSTDSIYLDTVGKASPNVEIAILDQLGKTTNLGNEGEICVKGDHVFDGYLNMSKDDFFHGDYFRTGDIGSIDANGYISLKGRYKEIINVGGKKLSPIEVESKITEFDASLETACIGVEDPEGVLGEVVKLFIVKTDAHHNFNDIKRFLKSNLESYKVPVFFEWIDEIPKTKSGKIQRQKLL